MAWQPSASLENLQQRAKIIMQIRNFFHERGVLEVDTPLLSQGTVTDPYVVGIPANYQTHGADHTQTRYLQTSPEYAMKRLLASGSGSIFQICKAFRQGDVGVNHNPEFTILEWYRLGFDHHALMDEMDELLKLVLKTSSAKRQSYTELFQMQLAIDPHDTTIKQLADCAAAHNITLTTEVTERDVWLDILWTHLLEPQIGFSEPLFLYDFPASQAALAQVRAESPALASRFEVYYKGLELANGFHELRDANEQALRFQKDLDYRARHNLPTRPIDQNFLQALEAGLPECSGVAVGIDRLIMLALACDKISDVISFDFARA